MTSKPTITTITMEDAGQSAGASRTSYFAAIAFAEVALDRQETNQKSTHHVTTAMELSHSPTHDIALNCC